MPIPCPPVVWPDVLAERGPPEDKSILLIGAARIGGTAAQVVAVRIEPGMGWEAEFRRDVADGSYEANGLDVVLAASLEEMQVLASHLDELLGDGDASVVQLATGTYKLWVMLAPGRS